MHDLALSESFPPSALTPPRATPMQIRLVLSRHISVRFGNPITTTTPVIAILKIKVIFMLFWSTVHVIIVVVPHGGLVVDFISPCSVVGSAYVRF